MTKILIVDDEADILTSVKSLIEEKGYEAQTANSGAEALDLLHKDSFDLVLLDILMPNMSGTEVLKAIRADPELADQRVAFLSVVQLSEAGEDIIKQMWPVEYFQKPITDITEFMQRLENIIGPPT